MLLVDVSGWFEIVQLVITSFIGLFGVAAALEGFIFSHMPVWQRLCSAAGGLMLIYPGTLTGVIGISIVIVVIVVQYLSRKKNNNALA